MSVGGGILAVQILACAAWTWEIEGAIYPQTRFDEFEMSWINTHQSAGTNWTSGSAGKSCGEVPSQESWIGKFLDALHNLAFCK